MVAARFESSPDMSTRARSFRTENAAARLPSDCDRICAVTDVDDIRRTLALYSRFNDEKDSTAWSQLWTENGSVTDRSGTYVGRPAIKRFVDGINEHNPDRDTLHWCANSVIALDGDSALAHTDIVFVSRPTNPAGPWAVGNINHYTDRLARHGAAWLFDERRIDRRPAVRTPLSDLSADMPMDEHEEIRRTLALSAQLVDSKDATGWSEQFARNGIFHTRSGDQTGRPAIKRFIEQQFANEPADRNTAHLGTNSVITVEGDTAQVTTDYLVFEKLGEDPWTVLRVSRAHDRLIRENGAWRFAWKEA
jgi:3-phenylpropionate/cinnamic acid dioxygenase small subunit